MEAKYKMRVASILTLVIMIAGLFIFSCNPKKQKVEDSESIDEMDYNEDDEYDESSDYDGMDKYYEEYNDEEFDIDSIMQDSIIQDSLDIQ